MIAKAIVACCFFFAAGAILAQEKPKKEKEMETEVKEVSGMSIVGTNEAPKSLIIVPWKSSEIGQEVNFSSSLLNQEITPVDKPTFMRELDFYKLSNPNSEAPQ